MLHDLNLRFNTPFINLWVRPTDFLNICENLEYYMQQNISFITEEGIEYPVGLIDDVRIYFQHYDTEYEAKKKWEDRKKRINYKDLYFLFTDRDGCTEDDLIRFDNLPYKNKIVFVHRDIKIIDSAVLIPGFEEESCVGICSEFINRFTYKRYLDCFDFIKWFNKN